MENPKGDNRLMAIGEKEYAIYSLISSSHLAFDKHTKLTSYTRGYEIIHQFHNPLLAQVDFINLTEAPLSVYSRLGQIRLKPVSRKGIMVM